MTLRSLMQYLTTSNGSSEGFSIHISCRGSVQCLVPCFLVSTFLRNGNQFKQWPLIVCLKDYVGYLNQKWSNYLWPPHLWHFGYFCKTLVETLVGDTLIPLFLTLSLLVGVTMHTATSRTLQRDNPIWNYSQLVSDCRASHFVITDEPIWLTLDYACMCSHRSILRVP